ncbi:MAG: rRNA maturation RNase YbeY [Chitinophagaceae bacterium]|nr:rRNA maturation RNase YbeY [Chitinophagaceae bacterium]
MQKVQFYFLDRNPALKERTRLKLFIEKLFTSEKMKLGNLSYIFCSDEHLLTINNDFLKHDFYTDVITFDLSSSKNEIEGEVYLSVDRIKDNAKQLGVSFKEELHRVIFHGALHLCGYKDKKKEEALIMRSKENKYLKRYLI